jgi:endonuclease/exonuclease/phosphatase family metal-dependent hydrolase
MELSDGEAKVIEQLRKLRALDPVANTTLWRGDFNGGREWLVTLDPRQGRVTGRRASAWAPALGPAIELAVQRAATRGITAEAAAASEGTPA